MQAPESATTGRIGIHLTAAAFELAGFAFREQTVDFGIDAIVELIAEGSPTGRIIAVQVKSGESYFKEADSNSYVFRTDRKHLDYWLGHTLPVVICLCDTDSQIVYWQSIIPEHVISTGKGVKVLVPRAQTVSLASTQQLTDLVTPVIPTSRYSVIGPEDVSHGTAKRYSFKILLNQPVAREEAVALMRHVTYEGAKRSYNRSDLAAQRWGDADADVVWTYLYPTLQDLNSSNRLAQSQWVRPTLPDSARPLKLKGLDLGDGFVVAWNPQHSVLAEMAASTQMPKEEYLRELDQVIDTLRSAQQTLLLATKRLESGSTDETGFLVELAPSLGSIANAEDRLFSMGTAPIDCNPVDLKASSFAAHLSNVVLYFTEKAFIARPLTERLSLARASLVSSVADLHDLEYELSKVR